MNFRNPVAVEHAEKVIDCVVEVYARRPGGLLRRKTGIALVITNDETAAPGKSMAELVRPRSMDAIPPMTRSSGGRLGCRSSASRGRPHQCGS